MPTVSDCRDPAFPENLEFGFPQDWSYLIQPPSQQVVTAVSDLLASADEQLRQKYLERLARERLGYLAQFFSACPEMVYFFVAWDHVNFRVVQRAGPTKRKVRSLLKSRGAKRRKTNSSRAAVSDRVYDAVQIVLDALNRRDQISYALLWQFPDEPLPQLETSLDMSMEEGWSAVRLSLPEKEWGRIPATPPPSEIDLEGTTIKPAPPTVLGPDPAICPISWSEYQRNNPMRSLDWRWSRSWALVRHSRYFCRKRDDEVTGRAVRFLRQLLKTPQDTDSIKLKYPDLAAAHSIRTGPEDTRIELEARILARQSPEEIAQCLSVPPSSVRTYVAIFFDVLDRLKARMFIQKQVIQPAWRFRAAEGLLMSLAYHGGPAILDASLPVLRENGRELQRLTDGNNIQSTLASRLDLLLQARLLPDDERTSKDLVRRYLDLLDTFPSFASQVDLIGSFSQIVRPFEGELDTVSACEPVKEVAVDRAA